MLFTIALLGLFLYALFDEKMYFKLQAAAKWAAKVLRRLYRWMFPPPPTVEETLAQVDSTSSKKKKKVSSSVAAAAAGSEELKKMLKDARDQQKFLPSVPPPHDTALAPPPPRKISESTKRFLGAKQRWSCATCGKLLESSFEVDYVVPPTKGGSATDDGNLKILCGGVRCRPLYL